MTDIKTNTRRIKYKKPVDRKINHYPDSLEAVDLIIENLQKEIGNKILMKETFSNHRGSLVEGERVTLISLNEQKGVAEVSDPFDISWIIPIKFLLDTY